MRMLFFAHSGLRYLVLLAGFIALAYFLYAVATKRRNDRLSRILGSSFVGLLDLQILLGIAMVVLGLFYSALIGHLVMMLIAAFVAHGAIALARSPRNADKGDAIRLAGVAVALVLIAGGIVAIGRSVFGMGPPPM